MGLASTPNTNGSYRMHTPRLHTLMPRTIRAAALIAAFAVTGLGQAHAQSEAYPSKPIRVLVPFSTGGAADTLARVLGQNMSPVIGQQIVVENRPGAGGTIGMEAGKRMPPDGYGYILISNSQAVSEAIYPKLSYDLQNDFVPMSVIADSPMVIAANPSAGLKTMQDLIAYARKNPGKLSYGSCGVGTAHHLAMEIIKFQTKVDIVHAPYRGCSPAVLDAVGGQIQLVVGSAPAVLPHVKQGKLIALAVTNPKRSASMPDVPTIAESGVPELAQSAIGNWYGFMAPRGTPKDRLELIDTAIKQQLAKEQVRTQLNAAGIEVEIADAAALTGLLRSDIAQFTQVVKAAQIKAE